MKIATMLSAGIAALIIQSSAGLAQQTLTGTITGINRITHDTIAIGSRHKAALSARIPATPLKEFKVQKGLSLEDLHAGNRVSFSAATGSDGIKTITKLQKQ